MALLSPKETEALRRCFASFDAAGSGMISESQLTNLLQAVGLSPTEEEMFAHRSQANMETYGEVDFQSFLRMVQLQQAAEAKVEDEADTVEAFVALGGTPDKGGTVSLDKIRSIIKDFELTVDVDEKLQGIAVDKGLVYSDFKRLLAPSRRN